MLRKHNRYLYPGWAVRLLFHSRNVNKPVIDHHFLCCIKIFASLRCKAFIQFQVFTAKLYVTTQLPSSEFIQGTGNQCSLFFVEVTIFRDSTNRAWQAWHFTVNFYERVCLLPDCQPFCPRNCDALPDFWYAIGDIHITSFLIVVLDFIISFWRLSFFKFELCVTVS